MHPLNVFNNPKLPLKYPSNWIKTAGMYLRSFKYAYQRATKGVADCDYWDLDVYFLRIFVEGLNLLMKYQHGYPGTDEFPTMEAWNAYLVQMRDCFYRADESNDYYPTPKGDIWWAGVERGEEDPDAAKEMCNEERTNALNREYDAGKGLDMMKHVFFNLWD